MLVTLFGISILSKLEQFLNASVSRLVTLLGRAVLLRLVQLRKASLPIPVTPLRRVTDVRLEQPEKAPSRMLPPEMVAYTRLVGI